VESSDCTRIVGEIAEKMGVRVSGWMRHDQRVVTEIWGKRRATETRRRG